MDDLNKKQFWQSWFFVVFFSGKYVGNRPIKLRKSAWKDRNIDIVKKKEKEKKRLGLKWWLLSVLDGLHIKKARTVAVLHTVMRSKNDVIDVQDNTAKNTKHNTGVCMYLAAGKDSPCL